MPDRQYNFNVAFNAVTTTIEYNTKWENGTGYLDFAVYGDNAPVVESGSVVKTTDPMGRRIIITGTLLGNVVMFERDKPRDGVLSKRIVCNVPDEIRYILPTNMAEDDVSRAVSKYSNVGTWLEDTYKKLSK